MRLTDLINCHCVTEEGRDLGRVFEFRARKRHGHLEIVDLLLGRHALIERYGAGRHRQEQDRDGDDTVHEVPWSDVLRIDGRRIVVRRPG
jgi:sporulation protein YlmC with PRC-barrel domain